MKFLENEESFCGFGLSLYTYDFDINGIIFKEEWGYKLINEGF